MPARNALQARLAMAGGVYSPPHQCRGGEMVYTHGSEPCGRKAMWVQLPPAALVWGQAHPACRQAGVESRVAARPWEFNSPLRHQKNFLI